MKIFSIIFSIIFITISVSCVDSTKKNKAKKENLIESNISNKNISFAPKIDTFKKVNILQEKLSENGIGILRKWHKDSFGWISYTDYYSFGETNTKTGMQNNLAYYLESDNKSYVKLVKIVLNINNSNNKKDALNKFVKVVSKTYNSLNLNIPKGLIKSINNEMIFEEKTESYFTKLEFEETKINTWKLIIESR